MGMEKLLYKEESYVGLCTNCTKYLWMCTSGRKYKMTRERDNTRCQAWRCQLRQRIDPSIRDVTSSWLMNTPRIVFPWVIVLVRSGMVRYCSLVLRDTIGVRVRGCYRVNLCTSKKFNNRSRYDYYFIFKAHIWLTTLVWNAPRCLFLIIQSPKAFLLAHCTHLWLANLMIISPVMTFLLPTTIFWFFIKISQ